MKETLSQIRESVRTRFEQSKRVLSFDEFLDLVFEDPYPTVRSSAQYLLDAIEHFGSYDVQVRGKAAKHYAIFDQVYAERPQPVIGHHAVQNALVQSLTSYVRAGRADKLIVFHGPNGSAKSSLIKKLFEGLEHYSKFNEGMMFNFSWIFPEGSVEKVGMGISTSKRENAEPLESYAKLDQEKIGAVVRSELHENPLALIPTEDRRLLFDQWVEKTSDPKKKEKLERLRDHFLKAELSHKNALIYDALLADYSGDYKKLLRHVRIERMYLSKRFRRGLVSIEPQFGVDAGMRQVTLDKSMANLPAALQSLNLFQLEGDLIDGNRGIVEYNDFLKRPLEHFKYLLGTTESSSVNLGHIVVFLDTLFLATTNDRQLEAFREHPEYNSFKARLEFIKVPYLLRVSEEEKIYTETATRAAGPKELMPHTVRSLALWAVLTRLKRPLTKNKSNVLTRILENLSPLAKAKLYDTGEMPDNLNDEERRELKGHIEDLYTEHQHQPYYEGLLGASARELKVVLQLASQNDQYSTLGPLAVFAELKKLVKRPMDFEYLRQEPVQNYHDFEGMIQTTRQEWLNWVDREMRQSIELQDERQIKDFLVNYMRNATNYIQGEKTKNRVTGQHEGADANLMHEFEGLVGVSGNIEEFRKNLISRLGAWSIENPNRNHSKALPYDEIFPDLVDKLRNRFEDAHIAQIRAMGAALLDVAAFDAALGSQVSKMADATALAVKAYRGMQEKFGYGPSGAKEALVELVKSRYL